MGRWVRRADDVAGRRRGLSVSRAPESLSRGPEEWEQNGAHEGRTIKDRGVSRSDRQGCCVDETCLEKNDGRGPYTRGGFYSSARAATSRSTGFGKQTYGFSTKPVSSEMVAVSAISDSSCTVPLRPRMPMSSWSLS